MSSQYFDLSSFALKGCVFAALACSSAALIAALMTWSRVVALRRELKAIKKTLPRKNVPELKSSSDESTQKMGQLASELNVLRERLDAQGQSQPAPAALWPGESASLQLNRRGQILRLAGKGKSATEIALDLGIAKGEVELLLKVQDLGHDFSGVEDPLKTL